MKNNHRSLYEVRWQGTRRNSYGNEVVTGNGTFDAVNDHDAWVHVYKIVEDLRHTEHLSSITTTLRGKNGRLLSDRSYAIHRMRDTLKARQD